MKNENDVRFEFDGSDVTSIVSRMPKRLRVQVELLGFEVSDAIGCPSDFADETREWLRSRGYDVSAECRGRLVPSNDGYIWIDAGNQTYSEYVFGR